MPSSIFDDEHFLDPLEQMRLENVCLQAKLQQAQAGKERSYPIPIACAILISGKKVLLERHATIGIQQSCKWDLPGGKIENGETVEEALCRELREELGIEIEILFSFPYCGISQWTFADGIRHYLLIAFACRVTSGVVAVRDDLRWWSLNDLPDMVEADQAILQRYFREFDHAQPDL